MITDSYNIAMQYRNKQISVKKLKEIEGEISKECRKYLIGKILYRSKERRREGEAIEYILTKTGRAFKLAASSAREYIKYSEIIDRLQEFLPEIAESLLNSRVSLSTEAVIMLDGFNFIEIRTIMERITTEKKSAKEIIKEQKASREKADKRGRPKGYKKPVIGVSVKDTPIYNPDAPLNALVYTIPSWISMIDRAFTTSNFDEVSPGAKVTLAGTLKNLIATAETVIALITEERVNG